MGMVPIGVPASGGEVRFLSVETWRLMRRLRRSCWPASFKASAFASALLNFSLSRFRSVRRFV
jgi:hypothetical protein